MKIWEFSTLTENPSININKLCKIHEDQRWKATPLYIASKKCNTDIVEFLLRQPGIDVNKKSARKNNLCSYSFFK